MTCGAHLSSPPRCDIVQPEQCASLKCVGNRSTYCRIVISFALARTSCARVSCSRISQMISITMANAIPDTTVNLKTFDSKSRVTFNSVDIIELDSLDYPPPPPSPSDKGVRVTFAEEDDDDDDEVNDVDDDIVVENEASQRNTFSYHIGPADHSAQSGRTPHVTAIVNISSSPLPPPTSRTTPTPPPPPPPPQRCIDIGGSGLQSIPDIVLQSMRNADELRAGQNQLQAIGLRTISELSALRALRLPGNGFVEFPAPLLAMQDLRVLDLADNRIGALPADIWRLESLEDLLLERNELQELPDTLKLLRNLRTLNLSRNRIRQLPSFLLRDVVSTSSSAQRKAAIMNDDIESDQTQTNPPLTKVNLRSNKLRGSIILGNYGYLTQLDVSENDIEILDLSALDQLETLQCSRNKIKEITLNGRVLCSLVAGNNDLNKLTVAPIPTALTHLDLSHNAFTALPDWIPHCDQLRTLFASHNHIAQLPAGLFTNPNTQLHSIHLEYNRIVALPAMSCVGHRRFVLPLSELRLHNNRIDCLPDDLFNVCEQLVTLNVSSNRLKSLPIISFPPLGDEPPPLRLEHLYVTCNQLCDNAYDTLTAFGQLRTLHAAYNRFNVFPEQCAHYWPRLEELILSGNNLLYLPEALATLPHLRTLRVHSNALQSVPTLSQTHTLRTLDLAHNQLDKINLVTLVAKHLTFLDLSCNQQLQVDPRQLQLCRSQRSMSLVDVSGRNRSSLPAIGAPTAPSPATTTTTTVAHQENADYAPPWRVGFSETAGPSIGGRLYVAQLRLPCFCNNEGLFGVFDGERSRLQPAALVTAIPKILLEERTVKETAASYMRYTLLSAHRELRDKGQQQGVCALLCHISVQPATTSNATLSEHSAPLVQQRCRFVLRVASVGEAQAILIRRHGHVQLTPPPSATSTGRQIGCSAAYPDVLPDPEVCEIALNEQDEFLVLGNRRLWTALTAETIVREIRAESNVILAAKRLQDIAQSYGADENLSLVIVAFGNLAAHSDGLMRELRSRIGQQQMMGDADSATIATTSSAPMCATVSASSMHSQTQTQNGGVVGAHKSASSVVSGFCRCGCCCESNNNCCHSGAALQYMQQRHPNALHRNCGSSSADDRSSPSGQSDTTTDVSLVPRTTASAMRNAPTMYRRRAMAFNDGLTDGIAMCSMRSNRTLTTAAAAAHERRSMRNCAGIVRAVRARIEEETESSTNTSNTGGCSSVGCVGGESDSALSDEQFKCWEYMLEQNTQLLFDKELNTISKGLTKAKPAKKSSILPTHESLSMSSPQLASPPYDNDGHHDHDPNVDEDVTIADARIAAAVRDGHVAGAAQEHRPRPVVAQYHSSTPFLSRQFGSTRSFHPLPSAAGLFKSLAGGRLMGGGGNTGGAAAVAERLPQRQLGGPNAAYFGSLQRLMPYNLEYDFAAMRERLAADESLEYDQRLQQYWGVATTEL